MWTAYLAMTTAIVPLVCMGVGYLVLGRKARRGGEGGRKDMVEKKERAR